MFNKDEQQLSGEGDFISHNEPKWKKYLPFIIGSIVFLFLIIILFTVFRGIFEKKEPEEKEVENNDEIHGTLPSHLGLQDPPDDGDVKVDPALDEAVEYLTFIQFYDAPEIVEELNFLDYDLPLDVKSEVLNYYDLNRRINLDPYLDDLSQNGFAIINNRWQGEANDFYSAYDTLINNQIPIFISSDFLLYHHNLILKKVWHEIESSFFYDSLWKINKDLFNSSRSSYENYLAEVGQINDPILEAKRLRLAYFAVALEILKPNDLQIEREDEYDDSKFSIRESRHLDFRLPEYLENDVMAEVELIKNRDKKAKSPVLLYNRNYEEFTVPHKYRQTARKNNLYLASIWLSSLFPLNYESEKCSDCLLDKNDWRINFTAASMIAEDIANSQFLKAEWARIYKIMSYFSGLEDTLTYIYFREDFEELFGDEKVVDLFSLENEESLDNIENYRNKLLAHNFKEIQGGIDFSLEENQALVGFRLLAKPHWPTDYLEEKLVYPNVDKYLDQRRKDENVTICLLDKRCFSFFADSLNFLNLEVESEYVSENTNYKNYNEILEEIKPSALNAINFRANSYWSKLATFNLHLKTKNSALPVFAQNNAWQERLLFSSGAALVDWRMEVDKFKRIQDFNDFNTGLLQSETDTPSVYIEPSPNLINDLLANTQMLSKMLSALGADTKSSLAMVNLDALYSDLDKLSQLSRDSIEKQNLSESDQSLLINWLRSYEITEKANKRIEVNSLLIRNSLRQDLNDLQFLIVVFPTENGPVMALSPIFNLKESN